MRLLAYSAGSVEPLSVAEARAWCRVDQPELDAQLATVIAAARARAEHLTGRIYRDQTQREELLDWPRCNPLLLPLWQPEAVAIRYRSAADPSAWTDLPSTTYRWCAWQSDTRITLAQGQAWPPLASADWGVRVRIDISAKAPEPVPAGVRTFILAHVAAHIAYPEALQDGKLQLSPLYDHALDGELLCR